MKRIVGLIMVLCWSLNGSAQKPAETIQEDRIAIDQVLNEMLDIISGPQGKQRDWKAFRGLFIADATFAVNPPHGEGPSKFESIGLEDFIDSMHDAYYEGGFTENEIGSEIHVFNGIAMAFQSFEAEDSEGTKGRGINSFQLIKQMGKWKICHTLWTFETEGFPIPKQYLD